MQIAGQSLAIAGNADEAKRALQIVQKVEYDCDIMYSNFAALSKKQTEGFLETKREVADRVSTVSKEVTRLFDSVSRTSQQVVQANSAVGEHRELLNSHRLKLRRLEPAVE